jgi:hypothetical protein
MKLDIFYSISIGLVLGSTDFFLGLGILRLMLS